MNLIFTTHNHPFPQSTVTGGFLSVALRGDTEFAALVELVDTRDLKSLGQKWLRVLSMYKDPEEREQQIRNMGEAFREQAVLLPARCPVN